MNEIESCDKITALLVAEKDTDWKVLDKYYRKYFQYYYVWELQDKADSNAWPVPQNHIFKRTAQFIAGKFPALPMQIPQRFDKFFFCEPDVLPFDKNWFQRLNELYEEGGKPFMGSIVDTISNGAVIGKHMNGAAVYPRNAVDYSPAFNLARNNPWDICSAKDLEGKVNDISKFYKVTFNSMAFSGSFEKWGCYQDIGGGVNLVEGVFHHQFMHHGCKDGSLIEMIRASKKKPEVFRDIAKGFKKHQPAKRYRKREFFPEYHEKRYGKAKKH